MLTQAGSMAMIERQAKGPDQQIEQNEGTFLFFIDMFDQCTRFKVPSCFFPFHIGIATKCKSIEISFPPDYQQRPALQ